MKFRKFGRSMSCWDRSLGILSRRDHSEHELRKKLKDKDHSPEQIQETIERLFELKFLDDTRCFESRVRSLIHRRFGRRRIQTDITRRGLKWDDQRFEKIVREVDPQYNRNSMEELLVKKTKTPSFQKKLLEASKDRRLLFRLQALCLNHLVMKGFSMAEASEFAQSFIRKLATQK